MVPCRYPTCTSLVEHENDLCPSHDRYRLASDLEACATTRCAKCKRQIKKTDWCLAAYTFVKNKRSEYHKTYTHVACEPVTAKPTKRQQRDAPKPFLILLDAPDPRVVH